MTLVSVRLLGALLDFLACRLACLLSPRSGRRQSSRCLGRSTGRSGHGAMPGMAALRAEDADVSAYLTDRIVGLSPRADFLIDKGPVALECGSVAQSGHVCV